MASTRLFSPASVCKRLPEEPVVLVKVGPVVAPVAYIFKVKIDRMCKLN